MKFSVRKLTILGLVAAIYVVVTLVLGEMAYANIQFRISEALVLLCFYKKEYCYAMTAGCLIANIFSSLPLDIVVGTFATIISVICISRCKNIYIASIFPVVFNAVIVGFELKYAYGLPLFLSMAQVAIGEFVCVSVIGIILFKIIERNRHFMNLLCFGEKPDKSIKSRQAD